VPSQTPGITGQEFERAFDHAIPPEKRDPGAVQLDADAAAGHRIGGLETHRLVVEQAPTGRKFAVHAGFTPDSAVGIQIFEHVLASALEVDRVSDRVVLITGGYLIAQGNIHEVRQKVRDKPMQLLIRCDKPDLLASKMFAVNHCVEARLHADGGGIFLRTGDVDQFYRLLNEIAIEGAVKIEAVAPFDDNANAIYQYLIGSDGSTA